MEFKDLNIHAWEAFDKGQDVHMQAAPSQAELLYKNFKVMKEKLKSQTKETIIEKYGNAADEDKLPRELLLGQSERQVEYDRAGRIIKGQVRHDLIPLPILSCISILHKVLLCDITRFIRDLFISSGFHCVFLFISMHYAFKLLVHQDDNNCYLSVASNRKLQFPEASMKKMFTLTTIQLFGAHGGRITNGVLSAASRQYVIAIVLVLLVLRLLKLQMIL